MDKLTEKELEALLKHKRKNKKKMKFGKKALVAAFLICIILIIFTMAMIILEKDTTSLTILATAGVGILPIMYGIYDHFNTKINLKHMEENYIENYDDERGIY